MIAQTSAVNIDAEYGNLMEITVSIIYIDYLKQLDEVP